MPRPRQQLRKREQHIQRVNKVETYQLAGSAAAVYEDQKVPTIFGPLATTLTDTVSPPPTTSLMNEHTARKYNATHRHPPWIELSVFIRAAQRSHCRHARLRPLGGVQRCTSIYHPNADPRSMSSKPPRRTFPDSRPEPQMRRSPLGKNRQRAHEKLIFVLTEGFTDRPKPAQSKR